LVPGEEQEVIEVRKSPELRRALFLPGDITAQVKATSATMNDDPDLGSASLGSRDAGPKECLCEPHLFDTPQPGFMQVRLAFSVYLLSQALARDGHLLLHYPVGHEIAVRGIIACSGLGKNRHVRSAVNRTNGALSEDRGLSLYLKARCRARKKRKKNTHYLRNNPGSIKSL
jgi:hypothetical protein